MLYLIISTVICILIIYWLYRAYKSGKITIKSIIKIAITAIILYSIATFTFFLFLNCNHEILVLNRSKNSVLYDFQLASEKIRNAEYKYLELKPNETILLKRFGFYSYNGFNLYIEDPKIGINKTIKFELIPNGSFDYQHQIIIEDSLIYKLGNFGLEYNKRQ